MTERRRRRRKSYLEIGGTKHELDAPGLKVIRRGLLSNVYWACDESEELKGYRPRTVRIHLDLSVTKPHEVDAVIATVEEICNREQQAMLAWADGNRNDKIRLAPKFDGTLGSLIELYKSDEESSYQRLKENTQESYGAWLDIVEKTIGLRRLDRIQAKWFRTCYDEWRTREADDESQRTRRAYGCIQMVKVVLNYGIEAGIQQAGRLRAGMETLRFEKNPPREETMTYAHAEAFVDHCLAHGNWRMALCQAIQWDTSLRQKDVIGQWRTEPEKYQLKPGEIRSGRKVWAGLTVDQVDIGLELYVRTSKTGQPVAHRISKCDLIMRCVPFIDRSIPRAPVALSSRGMPWNDHRAFGKSWRALARAAGIPDDIWNMDNRASGVSEGSAGGASDDDLAAFAGHANKGMTRRVYKRKALEASDRVLNQRRAARTAGNL